MDAKSYKILKKFSTAPFNEDEVEKAFGPIGVVRFQALVRDNYFIPEAIAQTPEEPGSDKYYISDKGKIYLENHRDQKIASFFYFLKREILTIVTALITAVLTTYVLHFFAAENVFPH